MNHLNMERVRFQRDSMNHPDTERILRIYKITTKIAFAGQWVIFGITFYFLMRCRTNFLPPDVLIDNPKFTTLGPYDVAVENTTDMENQFFHNDKFSFVLNAKPCQGYDDGVLLMIVVISAQDNWSYRALIRHLWGEFRHSTKVVFMVGSGYSHWLIDIEAAEYGDIIQGPFADDKQWVTYKHVMALKWVAHYCPQAKYIFKVEDHTMVNINGLIKFLARDLSPWGTKNLIACNVVKKGTIKSSEIQCRIGDRYDYEEQNYPTHCSESGIIYSQDVINRLLAATRRTQFLKYDDIYITGIIAEKLNIDRVSLSNFILDRERAYILTHQGPRLAGPFLFGPSRVNGITMKHIWNAIPEPFNEC